VLSWASWAGRAGLAELAGLAGLAGLARTSGSVLALVAHDRTTIDDGDDMGEARHRFV